MDAQGQAWVELSTVGRSETGYRHCPPSPGQALSGRLSEKRVASGISGVHDGETVGSISPLLGLVGDAMAQGVFGPIQDLLQPQHLYLALGLDLFSGEEFDLRRQTA